MQYSIVCILPYTYTLMHIARHGACAPLFDVYIYCFYTCIHVWVYLSQIWMDFASILVVLKLVKIVTYCRTEKPEKPKLGRLGF